MYEKKNIFCSDAGYLWWSHAGALWDLQDLSKIKIPLQSRSSRTGSQIAAHLVQQVKHCVPLCLRWIKTPCVLQSKKKNTNNPVHDDFWLMTACIFSCSLKQKYCDRFCLKAASGLTNHQIQLNPEKHAYICTHVREYIYMLKYIRRWNCHWKMLNRCRFLAQMRAAFTQNSQRARPRYRIKLRKTATGPVVQC